MIYHALNPEIRAMIDRYVTGSFGEDEFPSCMVCSRCGGEIKHGNEYFMLDDTVYCMSCSDAAEEHILSDVRDSYIYEL